MKSGNLHKAAITSAHAKTNQTSREVERMAACGLEETEIAYCLGIDVVTLRAFYPEELENGLAKVVAQVGGAMIKSALRGDTNAGQFILRSRAKWVTPTKIEADVSVTVKDRRREIEEIVKLLHAATQRAPVTIDQPKEPTPKRITPIGDKPVPTKRSIN